MRKFILYMTSLMLLTAMFSCSDEETFSSSTSLRLTFSDDTVSFDTVLTTISSSTKRIRVFNNNSDGIRIRNVRVASGGTSGFRINIDGKAGPSVDNLEIYSNDSIFMFIDVNIKEQGSNIPVPQRDSVIFTLESGVQQRIILETSGQDVIIMRGKEYGKGEHATLTADMPYLVYDSLKVDSGAELTIQAGTTIFFHSGASLIVEGKLNIDGSEGKMVTLRGDRTDRMFTYLPYDRMDAQWGGITLRRTSTENRINYADIHGGNYGVICDSSGISVRKVIITNTIIHNVSGYGLNSTSNSLMVANTQISNAGKDCVNITGGDNEFLHCTIAQFYPWSAGRGHALFFTNMMNSRPYPLIRLDMINTVITGYANDEIFGSRYVGPLTPTDPADAEYNLNFDFCLVNTDTVGAGEYFTNCIVDNRKNDISKADNFKCMDTDNYIYDFRLDSLSPAVGKGNYQYSLSYPKDMRGVARTSGNTNIGCWQ